MRPNRRAGGGCDEWPGWVWCVNSDGLGGWLPRDILRDLGPSAVVSEDFDTRALSVAVGQEVQVTQLRDGWGWCRGPDNNWGWVPMRCLT